VLINTDRNGCQDCLDIGKVYDAGTCTSQCPHGKIAINNICSVCPNNQLIYNGQCVTLCPIGYYKDSWKVCNQCPSNKFFYNNICLDSCPTNTATIQNSNICVDWKSKGQFLSNNFIVDSCPPGNAYDLLNKCLDCKLQNKVLLNNQCVISCPENWILSEYSECYTCQSINKINYYGKCVAQCPLDAYVSSDMCISCQKQNKFLVYGDTACSDACPSDTTLNIDFSVCSKNQCLDVNLVLDNNLCVTFCPPTKILTNNECIDKNDILTCDNVNCLNGDCNTDFGVAYCKCFPNYIIRGTQCNTEITADNASLLIDNINNTLDSIDNNSEISNRNINLLKSYEDMLNLYPDLVTDELRLKLASLAKSQIDLISNNKIKANPNLLNVLDLTFSLFL